MTSETRETIQRALGIIEGASYGAKEWVQDALALAVGMIEELLKEDE